MRTSKSLQISLHLSKVKKPSLMAFLSLLMIFSPQTVQFSIGEQPTAHDGSLKESTLEAVGDAWAMFRHDPLHTGYSTLRAPNSNLTIWTYPTASAIYSSPAAAGGKVFIGTNDGKVRALLAMNGASLWNYTTERAVWSSPAVIDGKVIVGSDDNNIYALNATTGTLVWRYTTGGDILSSPTAARGRIFVGSVDGKVYALNATNGAFIWSYSIGDVRSSPAVVDGKVFVASYISRKVYALNETTGAHLWSYDVSSWVMSSPAAMNGMVFFGSNNGKVYALNATNGAFLWSYATGGPVQSSPAVANGNVYVGSNDDKVYALNETTGSLVWNYATGGDVFSSPAVADGKVFVGSHDNNLYSLNETTGAPIWKYAFGGAVRSSPAIADGRVYIGSLDGYMAAFGTHDIAIKSVTLSSHEAYVGETVNVTVVVKNEGSELEYFNLTVYYNETILETKPVWNLVPDAEKTLVFNWNTSATLPNKYILKAVATILPGEIDTADNVRIDGILNIVKKPNALFTYSPVIPLVGDPILFNASDSTPNGGYITDYVWNFDDGNITITTDPIVSHIYTTPETYNVTLTVIDSSGLNDTIWIAMTVLGRPHAVFTYSPAYPLAGQTTTFNASGSTPDGGEIIDYQWSFGDGNTTSTTSPIITHWYATFGSYNVTLTVIDSEGLNHTTSLVVTVIAPPDAVFFIIPFPAIVGQQVVFNATDSVPNGGVIVEYQWDFGDGYLNVTTTPFAIHVYTKSDIYDVTLTVVDSEGLTDTAWTSLLVAIREIAITDITPQKTIVGQGTILRINVTIINEGNLTENFNATAYANTTVVETKSITLTGGGSVIISFSWDTTGVAKGTYVLKAELNVLWGETDTTDNVHTDGIITVSVIGDVTGPEGQPDGKVDIRDLAAVAKAFGSIAGDTRYNANYDLDGNGKVDIKDIALAAKNFGYVDP